MEVNNIAWPVELETGIDILDDQHHHYFDLLNKFLEKASALSSGPETVPQVAEKLEFLLQYAKEHFSTEEVIMERMQYPERESHREEHLYFLKQVQRLQKNMEYGSFYSTLVRELNFYIVEWFMEHIRINDMKLVEFLTEKSAEDKGCLRFLDYMHTSLPQQN